MNLCDTNFKESDSDGYTSKLLVAMNNLIDPNVIDAEWISLNEWLCDYYEKGLDEAILLFRKDYIRSITDIDSSFSDTHETGTLLIPEKKVHSEIFQK